MANYPTPHINAKPGDFGQTVLMPGDPLRAKFIAENFLTDPVLVNNVRGVQGYTGTYDGVRVSVMASGMGMPSIGIYSWELYSVFGVENIMRIGSAGALADELQLRDIVIAQGACTDSSWAGSTICPARSRRSPISASCAPALTSQRKWARAIRSATCCPPTASTATTAACPRRFRQTSRGKRWALWPSRWKPLGFT